MPTITAETVRVDDITFVEILLDADRPHRIRLDCRLDGPIWPPRTDGVIEEGWDVDGITTEIEAGTTAIGFATPVPASGECVELVRSEPLTNGVPDEIEAWIERMKTRVEAAERLDEADDLFAAADAIESVGGLSAVETLTAEIARDRRLATRVSTVPDDLRERLETIEIPTAAFARIAQTDSV